MEFIDQQVLAYVAAIVCAGLILFIIGKFAWSLAKRLIFGAIIGSIVAAILFFVAGLSLEVVGIAGTAAFALGAIFGRL